MIGSVIDGNFKVLKSLGEGLCSNVYLAEQLPSQEECPEELHFKSVLKAHKSSQGDLLSASLTSNSCPNGQQNAFRPAQTSPNLVALKIFKGKMNAMADHEFKLLTQLQDQTNIVRAFDYTSASGASFVSSSS